MHFLASSFLGPTIACVGHTVMQALHEPHSSLTVLLVSGRGRSVNISPRKKYEPAFTVQEQRIFPNPTESGFFAEWFFQYRCRVDESPVSTTHFRLDLLCQFGQFTSQDLVIVSSERIPRNKRSLGVVQCCRVR